MKRTVIDLIRRTESVGPRGTFAIQQLEQRGPAWFIARDYVNHPHIRGARSYLFPDRHIWVMFFQSHRGRHPFETYIHACHAYVQGDLLYIDDLYADVIRFWDGRWSVVDLGEMAVAVAAGELTNNQVAIALRGMEAGVHLLTEASVGRMESHIQEMLAREPTQP